MKVDSAAKVIWDYMLMKQKLEKADAILVLGSSDLRIAEYGTKLYLDGLAPLLIFSGEEGRTTSGLWGVTEAEKFASVAKTMGVPDEAILLEDKSTNTGENIRFTKILLDERGLNIKKFVLVQKPYMERRTYATFKKQWDDDVGFIVSSPAISFEEYPNEDRTKEYVINMMVGDLQRIKEYPALGFQIEQEIPEDVWIAYEYLVQQGFTEQLIN